MMKAASRSKSGSANAVNGKFTPASAAKKPRKKALPKAEPNKFVARIVMTTMRININQTPDVRPNDTATTAAQIGSQT